jgi:UDPglucose 6-dehydrogenase
MASLTDAVVDSVKSLSLNGSAKEVNGDKIAIRNICCVGAGYVGESPLRLASPLVHVPSAV